jgi:hypothetical protein
MPLNFNAALCRVSLLSLALLALSCGDDKALLEPQGAPPEIASLAVSPDSVLFETLPLDAQNRGEIVFRFNAEIRNSSAATRAIATVLNSASQIVVEKEIPSPNTSISDSVAFSIRRDELDQFTLVVNVVDDFGRSGSNARRALAIIAPNSKPLLRSVAAPDTVLIPSQGDKIFQITASASDSNGVRDILEVTATRTYPSLRNFSLLDDGGAGSQSGDAISGDGVFTITFTIPSTLSPDSLSFNFQALDKRGARSDSVVSKTIQFVR